MIDPAAVVAWQASRAASEHDQVVVLAAELPELIASAIEIAFREFDGAAKRPVAGFAAACWYVVTTAILDRLRRDVPHLRDPDVLPKGIDHLRSIYTEARRTDGSQSTERPAWTR